MTGMRGCLFWICRTASIKQTTSCIQPEIYLISLSDIYTPKYNICQCHTQRYRHVRLDRAMHSVDGQPFLRTCVAQVLRFFNGIFIFFQIIVLERAYKKLAALHATGRQRVQNLLPCGYVIHSTSAFSKSNIQGPSAEQSEACVEDVDFHAMLIKYHYDVKTAFYTPLVCLSLFL